jgi:predicted DNA-binding transcriptional regulator YafY
MSRQATISRYKLILENLRYNGYPSLESLESYLEEQGLGVSKRTVQRLLEQIRYEFNVDIKYHSFKKGYYIDRDTSPGYNSLLQLFHLQERTRLIENSFGSKGTFISFEHDGAEVNITLIPKILEAIEKRKVISINYYKFKEKKASLARIRPYLVKEYQQRFYLVARNMLNQTRVYGLDRIHDLKIEQEKYEADPHFDPELHYSNVIGLYNEGNCEEIVLRVVPLCAEYMRTLKWHSTQTIEDKKDHSIVTLYVHNNYELRSRILSQGCWMEVLKPETLRKQVGEELKTTMQFYKKATGTAGKTTD